MLEKPEKVNIVHGSTKYTGMPAMMGISMALMESIGLRKAIDDACDFHPKRGLTPGMGVKCLIAPTFDTQNKEPLYLVEKSYRAAPVDRIFGNGLTWDQLNDDALGRALDTLAKVDLQSLFHKLSEMCVKRFDFVSHVWHMDSTNWSFYGITRAAGDGIAVPAHSGHPKDRRRDLMQYALQLLTDSNRIIRAMLPASGNASDSKLDRVMLEHIKKNFDISELRRTTIVADSKLMTWMNLSLILEMELGFVSRCPVNFGKKVQEKVKSLVRSRGLLKGDRIKVADVNQYADFGKHGRIKLRFIAVRREDVVEAKLEGMSLKPEAIKKRYSRIEKGHATDYSGIKRSFESVKCTVPEYVTVVPRYYPDIIVKDDGTTSTCWKVEAIVTYDEKEARRVAEDESTLVLVTNLPGADKDADNARDGVTADGVRRLYDEEYVVEHSFRFLKSGLGIDTVYLQTPERENAMMFVLCVAALVSNIADAVFRRKGMTLDNRQLTMYGLAHELQSTLIKLKDKDLFIEEPDGMPRELFYYTDVLGINPQLLVGHSG